MGERGVDRLFPQRRQAPPDRATPAFSGAWPSKALAIPTGSAASATARSAISPRCCRSFCPRARAARTFRSTSGCGSGLFRFPRCLRKSVTLDQLKQWVGELATDERLAFFKLITGELRVGVSRLQVVKSLAEVAGVDEGHMAQRLIRVFAGAAYPDGCGFRGL